MRKISIAVVVYALTITAATGPSYALGGCGPNYHRDAWGNCRWGGQNQNWCLRHTGRAAVPDGHGHMICYR
jgi:hypothetical protein